MLDAHQAHVSLLGVVLLGLFVADPVTLDSEGFAGCV